MGGAVKSSRDTGRFEVTGPGVSRALVSDRAAVSVAQNVACRAREDGDWYVRVIGEERPLWVVSRRERCVTTVTG